MSKTKLERATRFQSVGLSSACVNPELNPALALTRNTQIDVQIANHHLSDHIEWDLLSPLTPEQFAGTLCAELGLTGEAVPLIAHAIHEELIKHKRDAWEWGVLGIEQQHATDEDRPRDRSGASLLKDKTGLGLAWGRAPKDGRGPKALRSVWRDWQEAEEFRTRFEVLTAEEVERREVERERASRCVVVPADLVLWRGEADAVRRAGGSGAKRPSSSRRRARGDGGSAGIVYCLYFWTAPANRNGAMFSLPLYGVVNGRGPGYRCSSRQGSPTLL